MTEERKGMCEELNMPCDGGSDPEVARFVQRFENCLDELQGAMDNLHDLSLEAKGKGLDPRVLRKAAMLRANKPRKLRLEDELRALSRYLREAGCPLEID